MITLIEARFPSAGLLLSATSLTSSVCSSTCKPAILIVPGGMLTVKESGADNVEGKADAANNQDKFRVFHA